MKKIMVLVGALMCVISFQVVAEEETFLGSDISHGGFGGPVVKLTQVNDHFGVMAGGRGGWILGHRFVIGGGGYGLTDTVKGNEIAFGNTPDIIMGYGGVELEYIINPEQVFHFSVYTLLGGGGVSYNTDRDFNWNDEESDAFFVAEPAVNLIVNMTHFLRIGVGVSYRLITGVELEGISDSDLSGIAGNITLKFGVF
jgi:hypothetical protein